MLFNDLPSQIGPISYLSVINRYTCIRVPVWAVMLLPYWKLCGYFPGFSPEIFEGVVAFSGVVKLGSITNVTQSAT